MEKVLGQNNYLNLVEWAHPRDPKLTYSYTQFPNSNGDQDSVAACPIIEKDGKPHIIFAVHLRPARLHSPTSKGLSLELVAGFNKDKDAQGLTSEENIKREIDEETGMKIKNLHRVSDSTFGGSGTTAEYIANCETPNPMKPAAPDMTELALISVPLEQAISYAKDTATKGIDVNSSIYKSVMEAQKFHNIASSDSVPKPQLEWTIANSTPNELQKDGLQLLAEKKDFLPEAAQAQTQQKQKGFLARLWGGFVYMITFRWLFG